MGGSLEVEVDANIGLIRDGLSSMVWDFPFDMNRKKIAIR
jgi:hypothetical protein